MRTIAQHRRTRNAWSDTCRIDVKDVTGPTKRIDAERLFSGVVELEFLVLKKIFALVRLPQRTVERVVAVRNLNFDIDEIERGAVVMDHQRTKLFVRVHLRDRNDETGTQLENIII